MTWLSRVSSVAGSLRSAWVAGPSQEATDTARNQIIDTLTILSVNTGPAQS